MFQEGANVLRGNPMCLLRTSAGHVMLQEQSTESAEICCSLSLQATPCGDAKDTGIHKDGAACNTGQTAWISAGPVPLCLLTICLQIICIPAQQAVIVT